MCGGSGGSKGGGGDGGNDWRKMPSGTLTDAQISKLSNDEAYNKAVEFYNKLSGGDKYSTTMTEEQSKYYRKLKKQADAITDTQMRRDMARAGYGEGDMYY